MSNTNNGTRFAGRVAIVTGASHDPSIGRATAQRLGREGAKLVINARSEAPLLETEQALRDEGIDVVALAGSVDDDAVCAALAQLASDTYGRIDAVVNTVGGATFQGPPRSLDRVSLASTIELNTWNAISLVQRALDAGLADGGGAVVNISSGTVHKTTPTMMAYAAAKAALNAITRTLAADLAPHGVRVNAVAPGLTRTTATQSMWESDDGQAASQRQLLGRLTTAADIANACVFLLSDDAAQITGQIIDVDGGNHLQGGGWTPMTDATMQERTGRT